MTIKSDYEPFINHFVKFFTPDGDFYGKLVKITNNNILLNPYLGESYNNEGKRSISLIDNTLMYSRGMIRGCSIKTEEEIKGLIKHIMKKDEFKKGK